MGIYILMIVNTICTSILIWAISISYLLASVWHNITLMTVVIDIDIMQECCALTDRTLYINHLAIASRINSKYCIANTWNKYNI